MKHAIDAVLESCPREKPLYLKHTDWLYDISSNQLAALYSEYDRYFDEALAECVSVLGDPEWTDAHSRDWIDQWYPEALRAAGWLLGEKVVFLAVEHHDRETPIGLLLNCLHKADFDDSWT